MPASRSVAHVTPCGGRAFGSSHGARTSFPFPSIPDSPLTSRRTGSHQPCPEDQIHADRTSGWEQQTTMKTKGKKKTQMMSFVESRMKSLKQIDTQSRTLSKGDGKPSVISCMIHQESSLPQPSSLANKRHDLGQADRFLCSGN